MYGKDFTTYSQQLPKEARLKMDKAIDRMMHNSDASGLNLEKLRNSSLYSTRLDDRYRFIVGILGEGNIMILLYVEEHDKAYAFAEKYKLEINEGTGSLQLVQKAPPRMSKSETDNRPRSRLQALSDLDFVTLGVPEEHWQQLREKVFTTQQLTGFKDYVSENAYMVLELILTGEQVDEAMGFYHSLTAEVLPATVKEKEPLFAKYTAEDLLSVGIPADNIDTVRIISSEKELEAVAPTLPELARQSLYALKSGEKIENLRKTTFHSHKKTDKAPVLEESLSSPITLAEFAPLDSEQALKAITEYPNDRWRVFLHPNQSESIQQNFNGPARIYGGAGTGKTVVVVHRAKRFAAMCQGGEKILVTTYGKTLTHDIETRLKTLCSPEELEHIEVSTVDSQTYNLSRRYLHVNLRYSKSRNNSFGLEDAWKLALAETGFKDAFTVDFCMAEWQDVIQAQNIASLDAYLAASRAGRGKVLQKNQRQQFWTVTQSYVDICRKHSIMDADTAQNRLAGLLSKDHSFTYYTTVLIDECQDLRLPALRLLRALAGPERPNDIFVSGDTRQRIYTPKLPFNMSGIRISGRSSPLKLNYRTTEEIYRFAMRLQDAITYDDGDGNKLEHDKAVCIFHGPQPKVLSFPDAASEASSVVSRIRSLLNRNVDSREICIMLRSQKLYNPFISELKRQDIAYLEVTSQQADEDTIPGIRLMSLHRGKGLEYSYVFLPCLQDGILPPKQDMDKAGTQEEKDEIMLKERNLLSVAITRAKREVFLSYSGKPSVLLASLQASDPV